MLVSYFQATFLVDPINASYIELEYRLTLAKNHNFVDLCTATLHLRQINYMPITRLLDPVVCTASGTNIAGSIGWSEDQRVSREGGTHRSYAC